MGVWNGEHELASYHKSKVRSLRMNSDYDTGPGFIPVRNSLGTIPIGSRMTHVAQDLTPPSPTLTVL